MPYVKPLASRILGTAAKTFSHGYAQAVVAGSQSSYAAQNTTPSALADTLVGRLRKSDRTQLPGLQSLKDGGGRQVSTATGSGADRPGSSSVDNDIKQYHEAWQKHQRGDVPWQQFQFARRIEWQPPSTVPDGKAYQEQRPAEVEDVKDLMADHHASPRMKRSYTTTALNDFPRAFVDEAAEAVALAQVNEAIAEEILRSKDNASLVALDDSVESLGLSSASDRQLSSPATIYTPTNADLFVQDLLQLAENHQYDKIPPAFEAMLRAGVHQPPPAAYRALLSSAIALTEGEHLKIPKALEVYSDMLLRKVVPDVATFGMLIDILAKRASDVVLMRKALEERLARYGGIEEPGRFMFRSNQSEHVMLLEDGSLTMAIKMFDKASAMDGSLDGEACASLVAACAQAGRVEDMGRIYQHIEANALEAPTGVYPHAIVGFGKIGNLKRSVEIYDRYKELAIENNSGQNSIVRNDSEVYAALIEAYGTADRLKGGLKFLSSVQAQINDRAELEKLREVVALRALLPLALKDDTFRNAFDLTQSLSGNALTAALATICTSSADRNLFNVSMTAFDSLARQSSDLALPASAMLAMHVRNANVEAAEPFWRIIEAAPASLAFIEPTTMRAVALIGIGQAAQALRHSRRMFARVRDAQPESKQADAVELIDEAIEVVGKFILNNRAAVDPAANAELLRMMTENGGLVSPVAEHVVASFGPEQIARLSNADVELMVRIQSVLIMDEVAADIAGPARFGCLLESVVSRQMMPSSEAEIVIERALGIVNQPKLSQLWNEYRYPQTTVYSPAAFTPVVPQLAQNSFEDSFDPYAGRTDVKGSNAINELLERPQGKRLNEALAKFRNMRRVGRVPRMFTYGKLIEAATRENNMNLARDILEMAKQDVPFDSRYRVVRYGWQQILDHMVAGCLNMNRRDIAARYHQDMTDMGTAPSANTFGLYITTLKENTKTFDEASEAVKIFLRAKAEGVEPSSFLYNALIGKLGKARRIDDCLFYFAEMRNLGIRPTSVTYGTIVNALCRVSDEKFAEEIFEEMESCANYKPRPAPYHSLMQFFLTTKRDRPKVLSYYERMRSKGIEPTMHTYKLLIDTHATLEPVKMEAAENVLAEMQSAGLHPEAVHYSSLIHAKGCVLHDMEGARNLFDSVISNGSTRPQPCLYQALFESMNANHRVTETEPVLAEMSRRRVEFTPYIANALIHGWTLERNITKAKAAFERVPLERREPSTYEAMVRAYLAAEDREAAKTVVNEALSRGYPSAVAGKISELVR